MGLLDDEYEDKIDELIKNVGYAIIQVVSPEPGMAGYSYTVGLTLKSLPEVFIHNNLPLKLQAELLQTVASSWLREGAARSGTIDELVKRPDGSGARIHLRNVILNDESRLYTAAAQSRYGDIMAMSVVQLIVPCPDNLLPWEEGYNKDCNLRQIVALPLMRQPLDSPE